MGLAPLMVQQIFDIITEINDRGHDGAAGRAERPAGAAARPPGYVLETGRVVKSRRGVALLDDPQVRAAYLGGDLDVEGAAVAHSSWQGEQAGPGCQRVTLRPVSLKSASVGPPNACSAAGPASVGMS